MAASSTSGILSALSSSGLGIGQGIDVASTVAQLIAGLRGPEQVWQTQQQVLQNQSAALTNLNSEVTALANAVNDLSDVSGTINARAVTSSDPGLVTASASTTTPTGSHTVVVNSLATTGSYYSDAVASSSTALATGTFTIQVGNGTASAVTIDNTNNTMDGLAAAINNLNIGVTASVVNDANGARLTIVSNASGATNDLTVTNESGGLTFTKGSKGTNASLTVDGVPISSASNLVTGVVPGLTLNLVGADQNTQVQIGVTPDASTIEQAVTNFVSAYNTVIQDLNSQSTYNTATKSAGPLASDSAASIVQSELLAAMTFSNSSSGNVNTLASLGITMNDDGTLSVDNATLSNAVATDYTDMQSFFHNSAGTGFADTLQNQLNGLTDPTQGAFYVDIQGINNEVQGFQDQINNFEVYIANEQTMLTQQYTQVDLALQQLPLLQQEINSELSGVFSNGNSSSSSK
jgi:flagellar hook-associated protein 2